MVDPSTTKCDYVFNETVLAYSHDDIQNLGHSMSDIMVHAYILNIHKYIHHNIRFVHSLLRMCGQCCGCRGWARTRKI
jgi:hypothetical protein